MNDWTGTDDGRMAGHQLAGASFNLALASRAVDAGQAYARALARMAEEAGSFWSRRFDCNRDAALALMRARSVPQLLAIQQQWMRTTAEAYAGEARRLFDIQSEVIGEALAGAGEGGGDALAAGRASMDTVRAHVDEAIAAARGEARRPAGGRKPSAEAAHPPQTTGGRNGGPQHRAARN